MERMEKTDAATAGHAEVQHVWEWPLRLWHWLFALTLSGSLATGLSGDIGWMDWHLRFGYAVCALLLFRMVWGFVGGPYSRWASYRTSPARLRAWLRGGGAGDRVADAADAHTPPGVLLVLVMLLAVLAQAATGLLATDDIFVEGPLVRYADDALVDAANAIHHRAYYLVLAAIGMHLLAHLLYGLRRDPLPLGMITGRKRVPGGLPPAASLGWRGTILGLASGSAVWALLELL